MKKDPKRPRFQIDASKEIRNYVKALAYQRGLSMTEFVLKAMSDAGDAKLKKLIAEELKKKSPDQE